MPAPPCLGPALVSVRREKAVCVLLLVQSPATTSAFSVLSPHCRDLWILVVVVSYFLPVMPPFLFRVHHTRVPTVLSLLPSSSTPSSLFGVSPWIPEDRQGSWDTWDSFLKCFCVALRFTFLKILLLMHKHQKALMPKQVGDP